MRLSENCPGSFHTTRVKAPPRRLPLTENNPWESRPDDTSSDTSFDSEDDDGAFSPPPLAASVDHSGRGGGKSIRRDLESPRTMGSFCGTKKEEQRRERRKG